MKSKLLTIAIAFINLSVYSQDYAGADRLGFHYGVENMKLNKSLQLFEWVDLSMAPQIGGLFATTFNEVAENLKWRDFYEDFDFGFKVGVGCKLNKLMQLKAMYNVGMLKFDNNVGELDAYNLQISVSYRF